MMSSDSEAKKVSVDVILPHHCNIPATFWRYCSLNFLFIYMIFIIIKCFRIIIIIVLIFNIISIC